MKDYMAKLEQLRKEAAECKLISDLATDRAKRDMFDRLCAHLTILANEIELAVLDAGKRQGESGQ
jgi:hypothetical protein